MKTSTEKSSTARHKGQARAGFLTFALVAMLQPAVAAQVWEDTGNIERVASDFAASAVRLDSNAKITLQAGNLDERLRLPKCAAPLQAFATPGTNLSRGGTVGVRCTEGKSWKIYVPVRVSVITGVVIARHALVRGATLSASDVQLVERDVATLPSGYLTDIARLQGKSLRRRVMPGNVITPSMLVQSQAVRRGQRVTLIAGVESLNIRMAGTAMSNGGIGDRIAVKNLSSGRTVEGIVRTAETVEILQN